MLLVVCSTAALAAEPIPAELSERFSRGLKLFSAGNAQAALAEFQYVHARLPRPSVTYNLALVYAELGNPSESVAMADAVLADPGTLAPARLQKLNAVRAAQLDKLGELVIQSDVAGVEVKVGGQIVGRTPFTAPLRVPAGRIFIGGQAPKRKPAFAEAVVPSKSKVEVTLQLAPLEQQLGFVRLRSNVPGAEIRVDGVLVGQTPELLLIPVEPGQRTISVRREGYRSASQQVSVGEGAELELELTLEEDASALATSAAQLTIQASEDQVVASVDGVRRGPVTGPLKLVPGPHVVLLERGGFYAQQQRISLSPREETTLAVTFEPTPELRATMADARRRNQVLGWVGIGAGAALAGGMAAVLASNAAFRASVPAANAELARRNATGQCGMDDCIGAIERNDANVVSTRTTDGLAYGALGLGAAALVTGVVLHLTAPNLARYDRPANESLMPEVGLAPVPEGGLLTASGKF